MIESNLPFFSIIIPIYNKEKYLSECIKSVVKQTYKNFELILVDDGSVDNSAAICHDAANRYENIIYIYQSNSGPYNARIKGVGCSKGKYLLFLDSDDELRQDMLSVLNECIERYKADLVMFNMSSKSDFSEPRLLYPFKKEYLYKAEEKDAIYKALLNSTCMNNLATKCIARKLFFGTTFPFIPNFKNGEDLYCVVGVIDKATSIYVLKQNLYFYRQNSDSTTHNYSTNFFDSVSRANEECLRVARIWGEMYVTLARKRCARACIASVRQVLLSDLSYNEKMVEIEKIITSEFYQKNIVFKPNNLSYKGKMLYYSLSLQKRIVISALVAFSRFCN